VYEGVAFMRPHRDLEDYSTDFLLNMYSRMVLIREFELRINKLFLQGIMPGTIHLSHGQEATVVGTCLALNADDFITITHRGHGQALAKGVPPRTLMAELFGKETGCCKGKGGSLHIGDFSVGALPAIAIVADAAPIAAGMALAFKQKGSKQTAVCFHGDGAINEGDWHEAMNLAAVFSLPVIFLCENNLYAVTTHITSMTRVPEIARRAKSYGMPGQSVDGNDPLAVYETAKEAVKNARSGAGPTLLECKTYRQGGHKRDDPATYRPKEEVAKWLARDPIKRFGKMLNESGIINEDEMKRIRESILAQLDDAEQFAKKSPPPSPESALEDVYA
jgi:pyruvate dehydrogenase E1 component alpha subunit